MKSERMVMMTIHGDRRLGLERRSYNYSGHYPERRMNNDRRAGIDRRADNSDHQDDSERRCTD